MARVKNDQNVQNVVRRRKHNRRKAPFNRNQVSFIKQIATKLDDAAMENKHHDLQVNTTMTNSGAFTLLSSIGLGTTVSSRIGDEVQPIYLGIRASLYGNTTGGTSPLTPYRFIVFQYGGDVAASPPVITGLLESTGDCLSFYNPDQVGSSREKQYRILADVRGVTSFNAGSPEHYSYFEINIPKEKLGKMTYNGASTNPASGALYVFAMNNDTTHPTTVIYSYRLKYQDA